jgi:hypothetical protein
MFHVLSQGPLENIQLNFVPEIWEAMLVRKGKISSRTYAVSTGEMKVQL